MDLQQMYTDLILEHNQNRENHRPLITPTLSERGHNPSCGDDLTISVEVDDGFLKDIAYTGQGCAISQASASMMADLLKGRTLAEASRLTALFLKMIQREVDDPLLVEELEDASVLQNVSNLPARVKCAVLAWRTMEVLLEKMHTTKGNG